MAKRTALEEALLEALRRRITKVLPSQVRACIRELNEEQLWWRPNEQSNSAGNLVLHVSGSMRHYLSRAIGGFQYERNRAAEFAARGPLPKQQLLSIFDETIRQATLTLDSFDTSRFLDPTDEPSYNATLLEQLEGAAIHLAIHAGQIVYITKMLKEGSLDDLWIRTHKKH
jgi:hypothetical protein